MKNILEGDKSPRVTGLYSAMGDVSAIAARKSDKPTAQTTARSHSTEARSHKPTISLKKADVPVVVGTPTVNMRARDIPRVEDIKVRETTPIDMPVQRQSAGALRGATSPEVPMAKRTPAQAFGVAPTLITLYYNETEQWVQVVRRRLEADGTYTTTTELMSAPEGFDLVYAASVYTNQGEVETFTVSRT